MALIARDRSVWPGEIRLAVRVWRMEYPAGHPDLVLARAVRAGVINQAGAQIIGDTRAEGQPLLAAALRQCISYGAGRRHRRRAERRLVCFLGHRSLVGLYDQCVADRGTQA